MNAMTKAEPQEVVPVEGATIANLIERVATNPNASIETLERLLGMQERVQATHAKRAYQAALAEMQPNLPIIEERGAIKNGQKVQSTYALWEDINEAIRPVLAQYGFALSFRVNKTASEVTVTGVLSHRDGHSEETALSLPVDGSGSKNAVQAVGSSTSYGQRYTAKLLLNLTSRGADDDGQAAGLGAAAQRAIADINACESVAELRDWKAKHYDGAAKALNADDLREVVQLFNLRLKRAKEREGIQ